MAKISGIPVTLTLQDSGAVARDLSNDIADINLDLPVALQDVTGLDKSAHERLALLADTKLTGNGFHNNSANRIHPVLSTGQTTPRQAVITYPGGAGSVMTFTGLIDSYQVKRSNAGALTNSFTLTLSNGTVGAWS